MAARRAVCAERGAISHSVAIDIGIAAIAVMLLQHAVIIGRYTAPSVKSPYNFWL